MPRKFDIPSISADLTLPLLLDANHRFIYPEPKRPQIVEYVELYAQRKEFYLPQLSEGVHRVPDPDNPGEKKTVVIRNRSLSRPSAILVQQTGETDIGSGIMTFERHFMEMPNSWEEFDFDVFSYFTNDEGTVRPFARAVPIKIRHSYVLDTELSNIQPKQTILKNPVVAAGGQIDEGFELRTPSIQYFRGGIIEIMTYTVNANIQT